MVTPWQHSVSGHHWSNSMCLNGTLMTARLSCLDLLRICLVLTGNWTLDMEPQSLQVVKWRKDNRYTDDHRQIRAGKLAHTTSGSCRSCRLASGSCFHCFSLASPQIPSHQRPAPESNPQIHQHPGQSSGRDCPPARQTHQIHRMPCQSTPDGNWLIIDS